MKKLFLWYPDMQMYNAATVSLLSIYISDDIKKIENR